MSLRPDYSPEALSDSRPGSVAVINLGCARNTVDSQNIIGRLEHKGHHILSPDRALTVIVNTCSFIEAARQESVDMILSLADLKKQGKIKRIIVAGCLAQMYGSRLVKELPEVDAFVGVQALRSGQSQSLSLLTPPHYAYLKICESCYNHCSFCAIPSLKGRFVSRTRETIEQDALRFEQRGVQELNIVGQDITAYGMDLYRTHSLDVLLSGILAKAKGIGWLRLLYAYPAHVTDRLIDLIAAEPRICKYIDVPLQHVNDRILKAMNRGINKAQTIALIEKLRRKIPGVFLRTTYITGFPGETRKEFAELLSFVRDYPFERVGVFTFSREKNTPAYDLKSQIPSAEAGRRRDQLMELQQAISREFQEKMIGRTLRVLLDGRQEDSPDCYVGRSQYDAPDVDGVVYVRSQTVLKPGTFVEVRISGATDYDLNGEVA
jgi:ribosomal protein S12 methylthiotransferase